MIKPIIALVLPVLSVYWISTVPFGCIALCGLGFVWWVDGPSMFFCGVVVYRFKWIDWVRVYGFIFRDAREWDSFYFRVKVLRFCVFLIYSLCLSALIRMILASMSN